MGEKISKTSVEGNLSIPSILTKILWNAAGGKKWEKIFVGGGNLQNCMYPDKKKKQHTMLWPSICSSKYLLYTYTKAKWNILGYQY